MNCCWDVHTVKNKFNQAAFLRGEQLLLAINIDDLRSEEAELPQGRRSLRDASKLRVGQGFVHPAACSSPPQTDWVAPMQGGQNMYSMPHSFSAQMIATQTHTTVGNKITSQYLRQRQYLGRKDEHWSSDSRRWPCRSPSARSPKAKAANKQERAMSLS